MPSAEFMKAVLEEGTANPPVEEELPVEDAEEEEGQEDEAAPDEDGEEEGEGEQAEEGAADDDGEAEEETEVLDEDSSALADESFYLRRYRTREEAERAMDEHIRAFNAKAQQAAELEKRVAFLEGRDSTRGGGDETSFEEWAAEAIESDPQEGMREAIRMSMDSGDQSYAYAFTDLWAEDDQYNAAIWRNRLETAVFKRQEEQPEQSQEQQDHINEAIAIGWNAVAQQYPDIDEEDAGKGIAEAVRKNEAIRRAVVSGDPEKVALAFVAARSEYRAARPGNGSPRRARSSDVERVARDKVAATVSTGDGTRSRRSSSPVMSAEEESILAGAEALGLKRRE